MNQPLFVVGAARSGTTFVTTALARHRDVAFWNEPKYVWRHGGAARPDDFRPPSDATPAVVAHIRQKFDDYLRKNGKSRFLEKTPSNCFRVAFMHRVFPEGLFLHLVRDGRDVAASALLRWRSPPDDGAIWRRLRNLEIPLPDLLAYSRDIGREAILRRLQPSRGHIWGPKYPGMADEIAGLDTASACALQWVESERAARQQFADVPAQQVYRFRYEEFLLRPRETIYSIFEFADLNASDAAVNHAIETAAPDRIGCTRLQLDEADAAAIESICLPAMVEFGIPTAEKFIAGLQSQANQG